MKPIPSATIEDYILQDWKFDDLNNVELIEITNVIQKWTKGGNWLDLGCGPLLTVWAMFAPNEVLIWGCDRFKAVEEFHQQLKTKPNDELPIGLQKAIAFCNHNFFSKKETVPINKIQEIIVSSVTTKQNHWTSLFDNIIQIGCFGCLDTLSDLTTALKLVEQYLKPKGRFISETWLPKSDYYESDIWGGNNLRDLSAETFSSLVRDTGLTVIETLVIPMQTNYRERFIIVAEKNL